MLPRPLVLGNGVSGWQIAGAIFAPSHNNKLRSDGGSAELALFQDALGTSRNPLQLSALHKKTRLLHRINSNNWMPVCLC